MHDLVQQIYIVVTNNPHGIFSSFCHQTKIFSVHFWLINTAKHFQAASRSKKYISLDHSFSPAPSLCKRGETRILMGENVFEILVVGTKRGDSIFCGSSVVELVKVGQFFFNQLQKWLFQGLTLQNINSATVAVTFSYSYMSWLIIMWSTFFISFLLLFSSTTSSGFRPIFTLHKIEKCEHTFEISERLKAKDFLFQIKIVSYSLVNYFLVLGIHLQIGCVCFCIWNISLFLFSYFSSRELQLFRCLPC